MVIHLYQFGLVASSVVLGVCLASLWWHVLARKLVRDAYECGRMWGQIQTTAQRARQVDAGYQAGWLACERSYRRRAPAEDVARRVVAFQASRN